MKSFRRLFSTTMLITMMSFGVTILWSPAARAQEGKKKGKAKAKAKKAQKKAPPTYAADDLGFDVDVPAVPTSPPPPPPPQRANAPVSGAPLPAGAPAPVNGPMTVVPIQPSKPAEQSQTAGTTTAPTAATASSTPERKPIAQVTPVAPTRAASEVSVMHRRFNFGIGLSLAAPADAGSVEGSIEMLIPVGEYDIGLWGRFGPGFVTNSKIGTHVSHAEGIFLHGEHWFGGPTYKWVGSSDMASFQTYQILGITAGYRYHLTNSLALAAQVLVGYRNTDYFATKVGAEPTVSIEWSPQF